jgi:hypothetical protein
MKYHYEIQNPNLPFCLLSSCYKRMCDGMYLSKYELYTLLFRCIEYVRLTKMLFRSQYIA